MAWGRFYFSITFAASFVQKPTPRGILKEAGSTEWPPTTTITSAIANAYL
jgi:hypothetical protein